MEAHDSITERGYGAEFILLRYTASYFTASWWCRWRDCHEKKDQNLMLWCTFI